MEKYEANAENNFSKELDIANRLTDVLLDALKDEKQFNRYLIKGKENTDEVVLEKVDIDSLNNAIKALKSLEELKRVMNEVVSGESKNETETGVVVLPGIEEENDENQEYVFRQRNAAEKKKNRSGRNRGGNKHLERVQKGKIIT